MSAAHAAPRGAATAAARTAANARSTAKADVANASAPRTATAVLGVESACRLGALCAAAEAAAMSAACVRPLMCPRGRGTKLWAERRRMVMRRTIGARAGAGDRAKRPRTAAEVEKNAAGWLTARDWMLALNALAGGPMLAVRGRMSSAGAWWVGTERGK